MNLANAPALLRFALVPWIALVLLALATTVASGVQCVHERRGRARRLPAAGAGP